MQIAQMHIVRGEGVSVLVCAAAEHDALALPLGTNVIGQARLHVTEEAIVYERNGGLTELDFLFCFQGGELGSSQFGVSGCLRGFRGERRISQMLESEDRFCG